MYGPMGMGIQQPIRFQLRLPRTLPGRNSCPLHVKPSLDITSSEGYELARPAGVEPAACGLGNRTPDLRFPLQTVGFSRARLGPRVHLLSTFHAEIR